MTPNSHNWRGGQEHGARDEGAQDGKEACIGVCVRPTADLQRVDEHATIGKADDGSTVAGKGVRSLIGFFNGARSQETKAAVAEGADVSKGAENTFVSSGFDSDDGLEHGDHGSDHGDLDLSAGMMCGCGFEEGSDHGDQSAFGKDIEMTGGYDYDDGSDHGDLSVGNSCGYEFEEGSEQGDQSVASFATYAQGTFASSAGQSSQSSTLLDKGDNVKWRRLARRAGARTAARAEIIGQRLADRCEQLREEGEPNWQLLVDELNTFLAWIEHCQTKECTFEEYQGWRPPLRPRRRRKQ